MPRPPEQDAALADHGDLQGSSSEVGWCGQSSSLRGREHYGKTEDRKVSCVSCLRN